MKLITLTTLRSSFTQRFGFRGKCLVMIAGIALVVLSLSGVRAQTNGEYTFRQQSVNDGVAYHNNGDPVPILTMDCLAANGAGQWTLSHTGNGDDYPAGWYLLANGLYAPSTKYDPANLALHPDCIPPGVVNNGTLSGATPAEPKATANLDNVVNYLWPDAINRGIFDVQGFRSSFVDFTLAYGFPTATGSRNVVKAAIPPVLTTVATDQPAGTPHSVVLIPSGGGTDFRDEFDAASDAVYLYITWCSTQNLSPGIVGSEVWATVIDLNTFTTQPGFPMSMGQGERPTIACDPRNNRGAGPYTSRFEVAYITGHMAPTSAIKIARWTSPGPLAVTTLAQQFVDPSGVTNAYHYVTHARILISSVLGQAATDAVYAIVNYDEPHPLTRNTKGADPAAIYTGLGLVEYNQVLPGIPSIYIDGMLAVPELPVQPDVGAPSPNGWQILDNPIVAMSNPYDQQDYPSSNPNFDQFHCLYQYDEAPIAPSRPLLIVNGHDNGALGTTDDRLVMTQVFPVPTPAVLLPDNPVSYCGAINQMGVHVHWRTATNVHYYSRDTGRAFDENIDENTLVTDICTVKNGTGHGGITGATILQNKHMLVWTDPNYGYSITTVNTGLYQPRTIDRINSHVGMLDFRDENVILNVGGGGEVVTGSPGHLSDYPYFHFNFLGTGEGVTVHGTWDYYGLLATYDATTLRETVVTTPFTNGTTYTDYDENGGGTIQISTYATSDADNPGTLIIHGGANFQCGEGTFFSITPDNNGISGNIDNLYEASVFPIHNSTLNTTDSTGLLTLTGKAYFERSSVSSSIDWSTGGNFRSHVPWKESPTVADLPYFPGDVVLYIDEGYNPVDHTDDLSQLQFYAKDFNFYNLDQYDNFGYSIGEVRVGKPNPVINDNDGWNVDIDGGISDGMEFHIIDPFPSLTYTIQNMTFNHILEYGIYVESDQEPNFTYGYGNVLLTKNHFKTFSELSKGYGDARVFDTYDFDFKPHGIYIKNLDVAGWDPGNPWATGPITISENDFTGSNYDASSDPDGPDDVVSAIGLENSTANVLGNTITDEGFSTGIYILGYQISGFTPVSYSLICKNTISGLSIIPPSTAPAFPNYAYWTGISSSYYSGYVKLNTISSNYQNYYSAEHDNPKLIFNSLVSHTGFGVWMTDHAVVDLSGVHGATSGGPDYAAFNTITGPSTITGSSVSGTALIGMDDDSHGDRIDLANSHETYSHWANYGRNNIYVLPSPVGGDHPIIQVGKPGTSGFDLIIGSIERNFFNGLDPTTDSHFSGGVGSGDATLHESNWSGNAGEIDAVGITYNASDINADSLPTCFINYHTGFGDVTCGGGTGYTVGKQNPPKTASVQDDAESCGKLYNKAYSYSNNHMWQMCYDTSKKYIETCPNDLYASSTFIVMTGAMYQLGGTAELRAAYLKWLESVLYLNTSDDYFCECVNAISGTLPIPNDTTPGHVSRATNIGLAVWHWMLLNTDCDSPLLWRDYEASRHNQYEDWRNDPFAYPLDTTLPPLSTWGLDTLFAKRSLYASAKSPQETLLLSAIASPNPAKGGTLVTFGLGKQAYVKIDLLDVLGHEMAQPHYESLFEQGNHAIPLSLHDLPSGTYYARLVTSYGEARTVKIVKE